MLENSASKMQEQIYGIFFHRLLKTHNEFIYLRKYEAWLNWEKKLHLNVLLTRCPPVNDNICSFSGLLLQVFFIRTVTGGRFERQFHPMSVLSITIFPWEIRLFLGVFLAGLLVINCTFGIMLNSCGYRGLFSGSSEPVQVGFLPCL